MTTDNFDKIKDNLVVIIEEKLTELNEIILSKRGPTKKVTKKKDNLMTNYQKMKPI